MWLDNGQRHEPKAIEILEITGEGLGLRNSAEKTPQATRVLWERPGAAGQSSSRR